MPFTSSPRTLWAFIALSFVWGTGFLFVTIGLTGLSPVQIVIARIGFGALTLVAIMLVTRRRWPRELRVWAHMTVVAVFLCVIPFTVYAWAQQYITSGLASIVNATTPIMTLMLTPLLLRTERLARNQVFGLIVGLIGVVTLAGAWELIGSGALSENLPAQLLCFGAPLCYGIGGLYLRRFVSGSPYDSVTISSMQLVMAAVIMFVLAPFIALTPITLDAPIVLSMIALGVFGTGIAYVWFTGILRAWGPARASSVTYLSPVIGVLLGAIVLGEEVHWYAPVGGAIVVAGILLSQRKPRRDRELSTA